VRCEPACNGARTASPLIDELLEHRHDALRTDACPHRVADRFLIRLELVLPAEAGEDGAAGDVDTSLCDLAVADAGENARERHADVRALRFLHLLDAVTPHDVPDLMSEHSCELVHFRRALDETAVHVDESAWNRECIHLAAVDDVETPVQICARSSARDLVTKDVDVSVDLGIPHDRELRVDLLRVVLPHRDFLLLRDSACSQCYGQRQRRKNSFHWNSRGKLLSLQKAKPIPFSPQRGCLRLLTLARDLRRRKSREKQELFVAEGVRAVEELLASGLKIRGILVAPQLQGAQRGAALRALIADSRLETANVTEAEFRSAAETESPQGVLAIAEVPRHSLTALPSHDPLRLLLLDGVQDPGNAGAILRTAAALGADATIALPGTVDLWNAKVVRGAMGASFRHPVLHCSLDDFAQFAASSGIAIWGADSAGENVSSLAPPARLALALGNEGAGLSSSVRERVTRLVSIPVTSMVESLNVAVAAGILLHQLSK